MTGGMGDSPSWQQKQENWQTEGLVNSQFTLWLGHCSAYLGNSEPLSPQEALSQVSQAHARIDPYGDPLCVQTCWHRTRRPLPGCKTRADSVPFSPAETLSPPPAPL